jgi:hypothetical protein
MIPLSVGALFLLFSTIVMRGYGRAKFDITYHMLYYLHFPFHDFPYFSFLSSFLYFARFALVFCFLGVMVLRKTDL